MTALTPNDRFVSLSPAAGTTVLAYDFPLRSENDLAIVRLRDDTRTTLELDTHYSFPSGVGDASGGSATLAVASLADDVYLLIGLERIERLSEFQAQQKFASDKFNGDLDASKRIEQELRRDVDRAWKADYGSAPGRIDVLDEGHFPIFDADGNLVDGGDAGDIEAAQANAEAAAAALAATLAAKGAAEGFRDEAEQLKEDIEAIIEIGFANFVPAARGTADGVTTTVSLAPHVPGSSQNCLVVVGGLLQEAEFDFTVAGSTLTWTSPPPNGVAYNIRVGVASEIGIPDAGSVGAAQMQTLAVATAALQAKAVTYAKMQDVSAQYRILGRKSSGAGVVEEVTFHEFLGFISSTRGVILYCGAGGIWTALSPGTSGHFLKTNGTGADPAWAAVSGGTAVGFSAHKNGTGQTGVTSATATKVTFGTEEFDDGGHYDTSTSRWTPPAGMISLTAHVRFTLNVVDQAEYGILFVKNGSVVREIYQRASGTGAFGIEFSIILKANGTDYFEVYAYGGGAGDKAIDGAATATFFSGFVI